MHVEDNRRRFAKIADQILRTIWQSSPVCATLYGIHEYDSTLGDLSADGFHRYARTFEGCLDALQSEVSPVLLDSEQATDYYVALSLASSNLIALDRQRLWMADPGLYASTAIWGCVSLLTRDFAPYEDRLRSMLDRMREIPDALMLSRGNISHPPSVFVQIALEVMQAGLSFFRNVVPGIAQRTTSLRKDLLAANEAATSALEAYDQWLRDTVLPNADGDFAVGCDVYEQFLLAEHYLTYNAHDLVFLAERVLNETLEQIKQVARSIDPSLSWQQLVDKLKRDHPSKDALVSSYRDAVESARDFVMERDLVTLSPGEHLEVGETPEFERPALPYAAYFPPAPFEASRNALLWVTPIDQSAPEEHQQAQLLGHCSYTIPMIALHEGYPGHHVQLTRAYDSTSALRKQAANNLLVEGWALYCEEMMHEQGFYSDPRVRLFQLKGLLWRVCRIIIDVGLHTGDMTLHEAVRMLVDVARLEEVNALVEVRRYTLTPTQPMSYVVGKLLILGLRDHMKEKLGSAFDLKAFHDKLLDFGSIPPTLIAQKMLPETWQKALRRSA